MAPLRPYSKFFNTRYQETSKRALVLIDEPAESQLWVRLNHLARTPSKGRPLFPPPLPNQNRLWIEFGNYIRQAAAYWNGARKIDGSSAGLVYYYSLLNLAKAELLIANPGLIYGTKINHGLSFSHTDSKGPRSDRLTVQRGVFPSLYEHRTGRALPQGTQLSVKSIMGNVPEIGLEFEESGLGSQGTKLGFGAVLADPAQAWNVVYFLGEPIFPAKIREPAQRHFLRSFREVDRPSAGHALREMFGLSTRNPNRGTLYELKSTFSDQGKPDLMAAERNLATAIKPYGSGPGFYTCDFMLSPSLLKSHALPMPPSLARYALMFYVSSLVRYRPSALDPIRHPEISWLIDLFVTESPLTFLLDAVIQITGQSICYDRTYFRA